MRQARSPDRTVGWTKGDPIKRKGNARVLVRIQRRARLVVTFVALAVAVGIDNKSGPALGCRGIASLPILVGVDPADYGELALRVSGKPQRVVGVFSQVQVLRAEAGIDEREFLASGIIDRDLARVLENSFVPLLKGIELR